MQLKLVLSLSSYVRMQQLVWRKHRSVMVSHTVRSGRLGLVGRMRSVLMMAADSLLKGLNKVYSLLNRETQVQAHRPLCLKANWLPEGS